jgi:hypothetical protein
MSERERRRLGDSLSSLLRIVRPGFCFVETNLITSSLPFKPLPTIWLKLIENNSCMLSISVYASSLSY